MSVSTKYLNDLLESVFEIVGIKDTPSASNLKNKILEKRETSKAFGRAEEQLMQDLLAITVEEMASTSSSQKEN